MTDPTTVGERSLAVQRSAEFQRLRRSFLSFIVPLTVLFLLWYLVYVLLAGFAPGLYARRLGDTFYTVGLVMGIGQVITTFVITMLYRSWADKRYDPQAEAIRRHMESGELLEQDAEDAR
ncbi:DUF485 domain-containing protein [Brachybacterium hainanense]|uniref:DUF485 domain-containing protein n=1 Tax=Brachybacterium hainanense TaxID=1541174 RepID=A0ABV6RAM7_9MICO